MADDRNAARKAAGSLDEAASKLGGPANRNDGDRPGYSLNADEEDVQALAAHHGDRVIRQPDGSHLVVSEEEVEVARPDKLDEMGASHSEHAETDTLAGSGIGERRKATEGEDAPVNADDPNERRGTRRDEDDHGSGREGSHPAR
ncbi:hypothetical protein GSY69_03285 [Brevibacterium sp. 5221]|uniref:Uncharacterized protein n=1 Tax=Brevibacterium rongguiense TaxID=2695267 RepID=A0A6N9H5X8_9MICO|nr:MULTISPECIES: hypothetical protein [Brevibacterium]MYM19024.1 hypothetical protein [Brevibacterium rongguiense]WAL40686.1 hypothetical protein BRM1_02075 [Brevibacterium sp. BRM-1]